MKKTTFAIVLMLLTHVIVFSQNFVNFSPRFDQDLKGDIIVVGNAILGVNNDALNDQSVLNNEVDMQYIDIDGDDLTFSSSSADVELFEASTLNIAYAGLYWSAVNPGEETRTEAKLKGPSGAYEDVVGTLIFDANSSNPIIGNNGGSVDGGDSFPYVCYADVTSILQNLDTNIGTYTVANVSSALGRSSDVGNGTGQAAGWALVVVYEDATLPYKAITSFDGFTSISIAGGNPSLDVPVSGFRTPKTGPVSGNLTFATLEGDASITGDELILNGAKLSGVDRPATNFFSSVVSQSNGASSNNRTPNSTNTLGFDTGMLAIPNPGNVIVANEDTSATITLSTRGDVFHTYFLAFSIDIQEPTLTSQDVVSNGEVVLQPNPSNGMVYIESSAIPITSITIFDVRGGYIKSKKSKAIQQLDISNLDNGVYFMTLENAEGNTVTKKILKK
jgi:hypothetical protein